MGAPDLEVLLARALTDPAARERFLADPPGTAATAGLTPEESRGLGPIDAAGLRMAAASIAAKRAHYRRRPTLWRRLALRLARLWVRLWRRDRPEG